MYLNLVHFSGVASMSDSLAVDDTPSDADDKRRRNADTFVHVFLACCLVRLFLIAVRLVVVYG